MDFQSKPDKNVELNTVYKQNLTNFVAKRHKKSKNVDVSKKIKTIFTIFGAPSLRHPGMSESLTIKIYTVWISYCQISKLCTVNQGGVERANHVQKNMIMI